ncbi:Superinfection immunity protein [Nocardioides scoriae]|uniref:Superinfection immunity protein n=2 Tax=Nocardioides scoriae TaxID=642780 RepID=A0A1H1LI18_9ACTN|nr:Superinfection immunity protein [Nocardioides scoriae]
MSTTLTRHRPVVLVVAWVLAVVSGGYFLPWALAVTRGKTNATTIGWVNFLLGWTIVGWVVALVMSLRPHATHTF